MSDTEPYNRNITRKQKKAQERPAQQSRIKHIKIASTVIVAFFRIVDEFAFQRAIFPGILLSYNLMEKRACKKTRFPSVLARTDTPLSTINLYLCVDFTTLHVLAMFLRYS